MTYDPNDPRLTAYALGELDDAERVAVEAQIAACDESRKAVDEVRLAARLLEEELRQEAVPGLAAEQRKAIEGHLTRPRGFTLAGPLKLALAASVVGAIGLGSYLGYHELRHGTTKVVALNERSQATPASAAKAVPQGPVTGLSSEDQVAESKPNRVTFTSPTAAMDMPASPPASGPAPAGLPAGSTVDHLAKSSAPAVRAPADKSPDYDTRANDGIDPSRALMRRSGAAPAPEAARPGTTGDATYYRGDGEAAGLRGISVSESKKRSLASASEAEGLAARAGRDMQVPPPTARGFGGMRGGSGSEGFAQEQKSQNSPAARLGEADAKAGEPSSSLGIELKQKAVLGRAPSGPGQPADRFSLRSKERLPEQAQAAGGKPISAQPAKPEGQGRKSELSEPMLALKVAEAAKEARIDRYKKDAVTNGDRSDKGKQLFDQKGDANAVVKGLDDFAEVPQVLRQQVEAAPEPNQEEFARIHDNPFLRTSDTGNRLSTFSVDVDTASYANVRRFFEASTWPPPDAVRIEEMVNYFSYNYPQPEGDVPFSINVDVGRCPWNADHRLARIGLKGKEIAEKDRPRSNLCFLVDVSGSMDDPKKLPLVRAGLRMLVDQLTENDRVSIVVYASRTAVELPSIDAGRKAEIVQAIDRLVPGGSTNGGAGIELAYEQAARHFIPGGTNRVILCTDGDFNVGIVDEGTLTRLIEEKAKSKVFLSVLGFGTGNLKDARMKSLADHGNGNYAYIDTLNEARKVLVEQMTGTLITIAKDVKIQVEFNPAKVGAYRLLGYESRMLQAQDFNDDKKDAGEIGAGHTVTALYELVPPGKEEGLPNVDKLKYSKENAEPNAVDSKESFTVKLKYKKPEADKSEEKIEVGVVDDGTEYPKSPDDFKFAASVAEFGMILRGSPYKGNATFAGVRELAESSKGNDPFGYRAEFVELLKKATGMSPQNR